MVLHCCIVRCNHGVLLGYLPAHHVVAESFSIPVCDLSSNTTVVLRLASVRLL